MTSGFADLLQELCPGSSDSEYHRKSGHLHFFIELIASVIEVSSVNVKKTAYTTAIVFWVGWGGAGFPNDSTGKEPTC